MRWLVALLLLATSGFAAEKELKHDDDKRTGKRSNAGSGHVVSFRAPRGKWWVKSVSIHGARYGGGYDPAKTNFTISVCDAKLRSLSATERPYELFQPGRFGWVKVPVTPVEVRGEFFVIVEFEPTATKGVFVGSCQAKKKTHSGFAVPGGDLRPIEKDKEWMIRVQVTNRKPRGAKKAPDRSALYKKDFEFVADTVRRRFPALKKKGLDWRKVCEAHKPGFSSCKDDKEHLRNVHRLLATLNDAHTGVTRSAAGESVPAFVGLYGAGLWIAADRGRLVLRASLRDDLRPGSILVGIGGRPAHEVHAEVRRQVSEWSGWSSTHFLDARLSFQFFPFGEKRTLRCEFLDPDGKRFEADLQRWGPDGKGLSRVHATLPEGATYERGALSHRLNDALGYVRITGGMSDATRDAFFRAFDELRGVKGMILDCRGMGGGGDTAAWAMAGRFYGERVPRIPGVGPTGDWQFSGPVVMLQDEREVSSAETFTWAMSETGRVVSVGRPTGGATIIPTTFHAPSGLFSFRMGVHDRKTPIGKVQPEGIGTPPDVFVPYEPYLIRHYGDPILKVGVGVLERLLAGDKREKVIEDFGRYFGCEPKPLLESMVEWELRLGPDKQRLERLAVLAELSALDDLAARARKALR